MNTRITALLFGSLLTTLWVFGLMVAQKKKEVGANIVVPSLQSKSINVDSLLLTRTTANGPSDIQFLKKDDKWYLQQNDQKARVEEIRIKDLINSVRDAKHEESADVSQKPAYYGLDAPQLVVTLSETRGTNSTEWRFFVGKERADGLFYYVNSSDNPDKVFAVPKRPLDALFVKNPNYLRSKTMFKAPDTAVRGIELQSRERAFSAKQDGFMSFWYITKPPYGFADFDPTIEEILPPDKAKPKGATRPRAGIKTLVDAILKIDVENDDDFVPLGKPASTYGLEADKAFLRIDLRAARVVADSALDVLGEKGERNPETDIVETLLIGNPVPKKPDHYYARPADQDGVVEIHAKYLEPLQQILQDPAKVRSPDVAILEPKTIDAIVLKQDKTEVRFLRLDSDMAWQMYVDGEARPVDQKAVLALLDRIQSKKTIVAFDDVAEADQKSFDAKWGLDAPAAEIAVYVKSVGLAHPKSPQTDKESGAPKGQKGRKDEKKPAASAESSLVFNNEIRPVVALQLGKIDGDLVHVRRSLDDGGKGVIVSRFRLKKDFADYVAPAEGILLAYRDTALPTFSPGDIATVELVRTTDKGKDNLTLKPRAAGENSYWTIKDPQEPSGFQVADDKAATRLAKALGALNVKKWLRKIDPVADVGKYGLDNPTAVVNITLKRQSLTAPAVANLIGALASGYQPSMLVAFFSLSHRPGETPESVTIKFGKETDVENDKPGVFALHSGSDLLFLAPINLFKEVKDADFRDRTLALNAQPAMIASYFAAAVGNPRGLLNLASPHVTRVIHHIAPDKVKEVRLAVRGPYELRSFSFTRNPKDKSWKEAGALQEFHVDNDKVDQLVKDLCDLRPDFRSAKDGDKSPAGASARSIRFVAFGGGPRDAHQLTPKEVLAKIDLVLTDGKAITLTVGGNYVVGARNFGHFAHSSAWPEVVFLLEDAKIEQLLAQAVAYFGIERVAGN